MPVSDTPSPKLFRAASMSTRNMFPLNRFVNTLFTYLFVSKYLPRMALLVCRIMWSVIGRFYQWPLTNFTGSLSANIIMAKLTNHFQRTRLICTIDWQPLLTWLWWLFPLKLLKRQSPTELPSARRSHYTNYWISWVQTIYYESSFATSA